MGQTFGLYCSICEAEGFRVSRSRGRGLAILVPLAFRLAHGTPGGATAAAEARLYYCGGLGVLFRVRAGG